MSSPELRHALVGTWRLLAASASDVGGAARGDAFGRKPTGLLIYTRNGRVAVVISHADRRALSVNDRIAASPEEQAAAFATSFAYAGRYSVIGREVTHHVEVASVENWVGLDLVRTTTIDRDRLILRTPPLLVGGAERVTELVWERVDRD